MKKIYSSKKYDDTQINKKDFHFNKEENKLPEIFQKEEENIEIKLEKKDKKDKKYNEEEPMI